MPAKTFRSLDFEARSINVDAIIALVGRGTCAVSDIVRSIGECSSELRSSELCRVSLPVQMSDGPADGDPQYALTVPRNRLAINISAGKFSAENIITRARYRGSSSEGNAALACVPMHPARISHVQHRSLGSIRQRFLAG